MKKQELEEIKREIDIQVASEIARTAVHEMAELRETKTNKKYLIISMIVMGIICLVCMTFTFYVGIKMIDFMSFFEIVEESEKVEFDAVSESGNSTNIYNNQSAGSTIEVDGK